VPAFNFQGRNTMGSWFGLLTTIVFWTLLLSFVALKLTRLIRGANPLISSAVELDFYGPDEKVDIGEAKMIGAFQISDFNTKYQATDKNYFSWKAQMIESDG
jgi:hypothetical protein